MDAGLSIVALVAAALALLVKSGAALTEDRWLRRSPAKPVRLLSISAWAGTYAWGAAGIALLPYANSVAAPLALVLLWGIAFVIGEIVPRVLPGDPPLSPPDRGVEAGSLGVARAALAARWLGAKPVAAGMEHDQVVERLFRFRDLRARHVMVPLVDLSALDDASSVGEAVARIRKERYSRIPVYRERMFAIVGVVHSIDLVGCTDLDAPVTTRMRPADYVPATKPADALLVTMRYEGLRMVVVVDEYGGGIGIVTIEDLLERIVGEIDDEYDSSSETVTRLAADRWRASARLSVVRANERFGWHLPLGPYETLAGLLAFVLGRVPAVGDEIDVDGHRLCVLAAEPSVVTEVEVSLALPDAPDSGYTAGR